RLQQPGATVQQVLLTVEASIARWTGTGEGGHVIYAGAWATRAAQTLIHISSAAWTSKARKARAGKGTHAVLTGTTIEAWVCSQQGGRLVTFLVPHQPAPCLTREFNPE
uniref:Uncharacterized protein n=1 Tax=Nannospalax galili TaxID=1026970 RepID=A0A8C6R837_NANGA